MIDIVIGIGSVKVHLRSLTFPNPSIIGAFEYMITRILIKEEIIICRTTDAPNKEPCTLHFPLKSLGFESVTTHYTSRPATYIRQRMRA